MAAGYKITLRVVPVAPGDPITHFMTWESDKENVKAYLAAKHGSIETISCEPMHTGTLIAVGLEPGGSTSWTTPGTIIPK